MLLAETLVLVLGLLSGLVAELALLLGMLLVSPGILLMALLPEMLLSGLVLDDLAVLGALAVELVQPPFAASLAPRGLFFPRLLFFAFRWLLPSSGLCSPRLLLSFAALPPPAPPIAARGLLLLVAESGTPRLGFYRCRPKLRTLSRGSGNDARSTMLKSCWLAMALACNAQPSLYLDTECVNPMQS